MFPNNRPEVINVSQIEEEEEEKVGITKVIPAAEKAHETPAYEKRDSS